MNNSGPKGEGWREKIGTALAGRSLTVMEVCGTHTMAIAREGIRSILPAKLRLASGPGCPVCVTPVETVDMAIALALLPDLILCTFGDMIRVPGSRLSLEKAGAMGAKVKVVYSPRDCLKVALENPDKKVVFFGVGFETTQPAIAAAVIEAEKRGIGNFMVLPAMKLIAPAMRALLQDGGANINGFLLPGHVSAVTGLEPFFFLAREFGLAGVVAGFEARAILRALARVIELAARGVARIENEYGGVVRQEGNPMAIRTRDQVFEPVSSLWRGLGEIPDSGLGFRPAFQKRDASLIKVEFQSEGRDAPGCRCADVLRGLIDPPDCPLFGKACSPVGPVGPCMVSSEGSCRAYYKYGEVKR